MTARRRYWLAAALVLAACGKDELETGTDVPEAIQVPDDLGKLIPENTVLVAYLSPIEKLEPKIKEMVLKMDPDEADDVDLVEDFFGETGLKDEIDRTRPAAIALSAQGLPTFIVPVKDVSALTEPRPAVSGSYAGVSPMGTYEPRPETPALARDLPAGDVSARVDLQKLIAQYRQMLDAFLTPEALENWGFMLDPEAKGVIVAMMDWVKKFLDSAESLEGSVNLSGATMEMNFGFTVGEGTPLDTPHEKGSIALTELAKSIAAADHSFFVMIDADWVELTKAFMPFYDKVVEMMPEDQRAAMRESIEASIEAYRHMGRTVAGAGSFTDGAFEMVGALKPADVDEYLAAYRKSMAGDAMSKMGVDVSASKSTVEGVDFDRYQVKFDMKKLLAGESELDPDDLAMAERLLARVLGGPEGITALQGPVGDRVLLVVGNREGLAAEAVKTARARSGSLPAPCRDALAGLRGDLTFLCYTDVRALLRPLVGAFAEELDEDISIPAGGTVPVWMRASREERTRHFGLSLDLGGLKDVIESLD